MAFRKEYRDAVVFAAGQSGLSIEKARGQTQDDWTRNRNMVSGQLEGRRLICTLRVHNPTRWIDFTAAKSIAYLNWNLGQKLFNAFAICMVKFANLPRKTAK
ncbi:hypothetical protein [Arthrobacter globiformis]|uniref:hypothetical protein n=1 Tax=Arthrobacter globiformis TaxID=1665 RepID=UPI0027812870|nr:hypothetical protein [Arthrobacter globiformis]MDQ0864683.1 hypothetical protein [Arthrobacter globiformis]